MTAPAPPAAPLQLTALTRLHSLFLNGNVRPNGFTALTALRSLRRLALSCCTYLPACLSQLTGLEALTIDDPEGCREDLEEDVAVAAVVQAVGQLTSLTHLALVHYDAQGLEQTLPFLTRLRSLWWLPYELPLSAPLPAGAWLTNLRRLALPMWQLHSSLAALGSACQLQALAIGGIAASCSNSLLPAVLRWAARRPALEDLILDISNEGLGNHLPYILELQRSAPRLRIEQERDLAQLPQFLGTA